jgi:N-terminal domain of NWD NACHT-NTPase
MHWYWNLSSLLLKENTVDEGSSAGLRRELEKRVIDLYRVLLSYQMKSVCSYYRNQFLGSLRDILKLDDWNGNLKSVQEAENALRQDSYTYNTQQITSHLEGLVKIANTKQTKLLEEISQTLQEQLDKTELAYYSGKCKSENSKAKR